MADLEPFDPDAFLAEPDDDFDPDAFLAEDNEPVKADPMGQGESAILGGIKGLSQNYIDEIAGGLEAAGSMVGLRGVGGKFSDIRLESDEEDKQSLRDIYAGARDAKREVYQKAETDNPFTFNTANIAGNVASSLAVPVRPQTIKGAAALSAGMSGVQGFGNAEGDLDSQLVDAGKTAIVGGLTGGAFQGVANALPSISRGLRGEANRQAYRTTGGLKSDINKLYNMTPEDVGGELLDRGLVRLGTKRGSTRLADDVQGEISKFRAGQEKFLGILDEGAPQSFDVRKVIQELRDKADDYRNMGGVPNQSYADALAKEADVMERVYLAKGRGNIGLKDATNLKRAFDKGSKFQSPLSDVAGTEASRTARSTVKGQIDDVIADIADPSVAARYKQSREGASRLLSAQSALEQAEKRNIANKTFGLTDLLGGGLGATAGAVFGGPAALAGIAAGVAVNKAVSNYGASTMAVLLKKASDLVGKHGFQEASRRMASAVGASTASQIMGQIQEQPKKGYDLKARMSKMPPQYRAVLEKAESRGSNAAAVTHHTLFSKDPEYRKLMQEMDEQAEQ